MNDEALNNSLNRLSEEVSSLRNQLNNYINSQGTIVARLAEWKESADEKLKDLAGQIKDAENDRRDDRDMFKSTIMDIKEALIKVKDDVDIAHKNHRTYTKLQSNSATKIDKLEKSDEASKTRTKLILCILVGLNALLILYGTLYPVIGGK